MSMETSRAVLARLEDDSNADMRMLALEFLQELDPADLLAPYADAVIARLEDPLHYVREQALVTLGKLEPATLAQHADAVLARLEDSDEDVRMQALETLGRLEPVTLMRYADAVAARLEDSSGVVRTWALETLRQLEPATLARHADAVVARLEDSNEHPRHAALQTLAKLEPAMLAQYAGAVIARLEDSGEDARCEAMETLGQLEPATLAQHANAVITTLEDERMHERALGLLRGLPRYVTREYRVDIFDSRPVRSRLLGRLAWYKFRLHLRVQRLSLYWYALPYRPSGPGHARDVEAWDRMVEG